MKVAEEVIRALYAIIDAIKAKSGGNDGGDNSDNNQRCLSYDNQYLFIYPKYRCVKFDKPDSFEILNSQDGSLNVEDFYNKFLGADGNYTNGVFLYNEEQLQFINDNKHMFYLDMSEKPIDVENILFYTIEEVVNNGNFDFLNQCYDYIKQNIQETLYILTDVPLEQ